MNTARQVTHSQYVKALETIRRLKQDLLQLAERKGNLDPEVIALSQTIDRYIVEVQQYWRLTGTQTG
ncbi:MAG: aspartyl-phosphate phosphatase Spo0E family protein [Firmicutes bacterium]|nr:aspartyl-phosphate phosphatase Spo0E family protein [Alicyclobacillaceae bacterium]MCL6497323.1 aspartyl-phosphate phosphatase Spo0E family protein [Bacillota bacterium]